MPRGRGFGFGAGQGAGRAAGRPGNLHGFCRTFPWLPRRWWAAPGTAQYACPPAPGWGSRATVPAVPTNEAEALKQQAAFLREQLEAAESRINELEQK